MARRSALQQNKDDAKRESGEMRPHFL